MNSRTYFIPPPPIFRGFTDRGWEREKRKAALGSNELIHDDIAAQAYVENFALKIFNNATVLVESGKATGYYKHTIRQTLSQMADSL